MTFLSPSTFLSVIDPVLSDTYVTSINKLQLLSLPNFRNLSKDLELLIKKCFWNSTQYFQGGGDEDCYLM